MDERGLSFELDGDTLTVRLTLQSVGAEGGVIEETMETAVRFRN